MSDVPDDSPRLGYDNCSLQIPFCPVQNGEFGSSATRSRSGVLDAAAARLFREKVHGIGNLQRSPRIEPLSFGPSDQGSVVPVDVFDVKQEAGPAQFSNRLAACGIE